MRNNKKIALLLFLAAAPLFMQCKDSGEELEPDEENELITTVTLHFTDEASGTTSTFLFQDKDGTGGNDASQFDTIRLAPNSSYTLELEFLDESKNPTDDITGEILEEAVDHLVLITPNPSTALTYHYSDEDSNGLPLGLSGHVNTASAVSGKLKVQLRHQPGTKDGTSTPGTDDVNIDFPLIIE
ncbi:hypothetical protein CLV98_101525 [Dyadobacter jejuensis]|uniref:Type 1 periplasmic binding fold superfamily protein n=1 Tax=Dyadobacter jejuensis TaxID=1082580 RepID=A0A316ASU9_9BACT|nr:hypothetical protein [Dyadobacter jejuensis]PWJ60344.1 hypothetical protein CLV98_101525 [Dyadobacter jejuensis]